MKKQVGTIFSPYDVDAHFFNEGDETCSGCHTPLNLEPTNERELGLRSLKDGWASTYDNRAILNGATVEFLNAKGVKGLDYILVNSTPPLFLPMPRQYIRVDKNASAIEFCEFCDVCQRTVQVTGIDICVKDDIDDKAVVATDIFVGSIDEQNRNIIFGNQIASDVKKRFPKLVSRPVYLNQKEAHEPA